MIARHSAMAAASSALVLVGGSSPSAAGAGSSAWSSKAGTKAEAQWAQQRSGV